MQIKHVEKQGFNNEQATSLIFYMTGHDRELAGTGETTKEPEDIQDFAHLLSVITILTFYFIHSDYDRSVAKGNFKGS